MLDQDDVHAVQAGSGHQPQVARHDQRCLFQGQEGFLLLIHARDHRLGLRHEALAICATERVRHGQFGAQRIDVTAIDLELVVQVRAGGQARHAYVTDDLALLHAGTGADTLGEAARVRRWSDSAGRAGSPTALP